MNIIKKILSFVLVTAILVSTAPVIGFADSGISGERTIFNDYMKFTFNFDTGGFAVETDKGNPRKVLDDNIPLLYAEDKERSNGTSFITVRIDKKDYVFGQNYNSLFTSNSSSYGNVTFDDNIIEIPWTINGVTVILTAALGNNTESDITGNVGLSFKVINSGSKKVSIRLLLDTALGEKIDAPYFVVGTNENPTMTETEYSGNDVPNQIRGVDSLTNPSRMLYILMQANGWNGGTKPDKVILGHWANLANTRYEYKLDSDSYCDFANYSNDYRVPDSAAAIYWENIGENFVGELLYGVGNFSNTASDTPIGIDISIGRVELDTNNDDDKTTYKNDGIIDVIVEIDNTVDNSVELSEVLVNFKYDKDKFELYEGNSNVEYAKLRKQKKTLTYKLKVKEQDDLCAGTVFVSVAGYKVTANGDTEKIETAAERSVVIPSVGTVSEVQMNSVNPKIVYTDGEKAITISGKMGPLDAVLADNSNVTLKLYHKTSDHCVTVLKKNIAFLDDTYETLTFTTDETLYVGEYRIVFEINDPTIREQLNCTSIECDKTVEVSADSKYRIKSYGMMALVRMNDKDGGNVKYDFYKFNNENDFMKFYTGDTRAYGEKTGTGIKHNFSSGESAILESEILLTIRANLREMQDEATGEYFWQADFADGDIVINNMLSYEGDTPLKVYKKGNELRVEGDGLLKVVNSATVWRSDWSISVTQGSTLYTLNDENLTEELGTKANSTTVDTVSLSLDGVGAIVQTLGGFAVDLKYGVLTSDWEDGEILYGISFGGKISIPIKAKKDKTDENSGEGQYFQTTGEAYAIEDIAEDDDDFGESLQNLFDETLTDDVDDYSDEFANLFDDEEFYSENPTKKHSFDKKAVVSSLKDKVMKDDDDDLPEGEISATVNNVLFGEKLPKKQDGSSKKDTGFIGIDAEFEIALPEDVLGSFVSNAPGLEAQVKINTIENEYEIHAGLDIKIISCEGTLAFKQVSVKNKDTIVPDKIEFYLRGMKIPVAPPVLYITGLGGGINDLADTIGGSFDELPPITILLYTQLEAIGVLEGDFNASVNLEGISLEGDMTLKTNGLAKVMKLNAGISARWIEPWELSLYGNVNIIDGLIRGGITVTIADDYFYGYVYASIYIPDSIPLVGGKELAGIEAAVSHEFIGANIKIIGIKFGVIYYWGDNVSFGRNIDLSPPDTGKSGSNKSSSNMIDTESSENAIGYYGTNVFKLSTKLLSGGNVVTGEGGKVWKQTKVSVNTAKDQDALLLEIPYKGKATPSSANIRIINPDSKPVTLIADDGKDGGNMLVQNRDDGNYIYVTVTDKGLIKNGTWIVEYDSDADLEITEFGMNGVDDIPELSEDDTRLKLTSEKDDEKQTVSVSWNIKGADESDKGTVDVYLTKYENIISKIQTSKNTGDILGTNILHKTDVNLKGYSGETEITLPEALDNGKYYALVMLSTSEGVSLSISKAYTENSKDYNAYIDFYNPNLPKSVEKVEINYGGNGEIFVNVTDADEPDYTHYIAEIIASDGTVLENNIGQFEAGKKFTFGKDAILTPGKKYTVSVKTLKEKRKQTGDKNSPYKTYYYYGSGEEPSKELKMPDSFEPPKLLSATVNFDTDGDEINTNVKDVVIEYEFDKPVFVELDLNGNKVYSFGVDPDPNSSKFSYFKTNWRFVLDDLKDGDYIVDFAAYCKNKDHITGHESSNVDNAYFAFTVDTSTPVLTLAKTSVVDETENRSVAFGSNTITTDSSGNYEIEGYTEPSAKLMLDGTELSSDEITFLSGGNFKIKRTLSNGETYREHTISAVDKAGNVSEVTVYAIRKDAFTFDNIELYLDGNLITADNGVKTVNLKNGQQANLSVYANNKYGNKFMIDNDQIDWNLLYSKNIVDFDEGNIVALTYGETAVKAKLVTGNAKKVSGTVRTEGLTDYVIFNISKSTKEDLADMIETAKTMLNNNPTADEDRKNALQTAISDAESVLNNPSSDDDDYSDAVTNLRNAMDSFKKHLTLGGSGNVKHLSVTVTDTEHGSVKVSQKSVVYGNSLTITAIPDEGYTVADMLINGVSVGRTDVYKINSVKENINVKVIFAEKTDLPFVDVIESDWFYEYVKEAYKNGYMLGTSDTKFEPETRLTRAMFTTILYRIEGEPETDGSVPFEDIDGSMYYYDALLWAYQNGIVNGVSDTEFAPDAEITREQMAAIIYRYVKEKGLDISVGEKTDISAYSDCNMISDYAVDAFKYATGSGLIVGTSKTTLEPLANATRSEAATIFVRLAGILEKQ